MNAHPATVNVLLSRQRRIRPWSIRREVVRINGAKSVVDDAELRAMDVRVRERYSARRRTSIARSSASIIFRRKGGLQGPPGRNTALQYYHLANISQLALLRESQFGTNAHGVFAAVRFRPERWPRIIFFFRTSGFAAKRFSVATTP